ncbi:MAG: ABC transporter substrate-binding protein [Treponema sp.]|jgi:ABC-type glycerol-3-phosphate transport system substrate-binding protein|nr:ABC transporter substrate-binding protein [Treponema sp.]
MKSFLVSILVLALALLGCKAKEGVASAAASPDEKVTLAVWNFTNEFEYGMLDLYKEAHPNITIEHTLVQESAGYVNKLVSALTSGQGAPDCFALNVNYTRQFVESGQVLDLTDIYNLYKDALVPYQVEIGSDNGKVYALSWQATPGAFYYRRSLAKKYLGTDDPAQIQTYLSDMNKFMDTAKTLHDKSGGSCVIVPTFTGLLDAYTPNRKQPWVVDGSLVIDPILLDYMDVSRTIREKGYDARLGGWSEGWFNGMKGILKDENGNTIDVFGYFLPTWGISYVFKTNAMETSGDWAIAPGPMYHYNGGTYIAAYKGTKHPAEAKEFIRYMTADDDFLEAWAIKRGDLTSNNRVNAKVKDQFSDPYVGGQNHWALFSELAPFVNGKLVQGTDDAINAIFNEAVTAYANNEKSKEKALADFKDQVASEMGF